MTAPRALAVRAASAMEAKKAADVVILEIGAFTPVADYFVIGSADTAVQIRAITEAVEEAMAEAGVPLLGREGHARARWILLDFGAVVVHVFGPEARALYDLERLWADAPIVVER
ncbi:MAG: ribosome silencing factor [Armatimonadota bacterium]|nr:ribosome silencing factor [Armatimonadota bacterium]MDR7402437.1 ribosome silencing factor [Armatimonadota bacterium]MDR7437911.1 ribosome silencing factor [Armatimonadota bacterium]MDR7472136.1 ribosome silencing factor [Armatimonadota bacterium]MDR7507119.1 ribosome silencing factor [Armatimonadota bacterium]